MKVSVIVPIHNAETYLPACLNSILRQTSDDMEILLIEDASEDNSGMICDTYAAQHACIRTVHINQRSAGGARNEGLRLATGEYIVFVDADDYLPDEDSIQKMTDLLDATNADVAVGNYCRLWDDRCLEATKHSTFSHMDPKSGNFRYSGFFSVGTLSYVWGKVYRHSFLKEYGICYGSYKYAEDKMFNLLCYIEQARYVFFDNVVYTYRKNNASISNQYQKDCAQCWLQIADDLWHYLDDKNLCEKYGDLVAYTINFAAFFDGKSEYCRSGGKIKAVYNLLRIYAQSPVASRCFRQMARGKYIRFASGLGWKIVMWGFATLMRVKALYILAFGIKLLIDLKIDECLSDTGRKKSKR